MVTANGAIFAESKAVPAYLENEEAEPDVGEGNNLDESDVNEKKNWCSVAGSTVGGKAPHWKITAACKSHDYFIGSFGNLF